jgi:hypothetical protein
MTDKNETIDLGDNVTGRWLGWSPDRSIQSNADLYAGIDDIEKCCLVLTHLMPDGVTPHEGIVTVDTSPSTIKVFPRHPMWQVHSWEPLTLTPSVLCSCGWHGFITNGKWVRA